MRRRAERGLVALLVFATSIANAQQQAPAPADRVVQGADLELLRTVREVGTRIAGILGKPARADILAIRADDAARSDAARARAGRVLPAERAAARGRAWRDLGLGTGADPAELVMALELDLAGMTLDAAGERLLVDATRLPADTGQPGSTLDEDASLILATGVAPDEPVAGHFVAHLLMDDAPPREPTTDSLLARAAWSEGGANLAALLLLVGGVGLESEVLSGKLRPDDALGGRLLPPGMRAASPVVAKLVEFASLDGFAQSAALAKAGGFRRLALERKQRRTTRDVLHLDRPPADPQDLVVPQPPASIGLAPSDRDTLGEMGVVVLVSLLTGKDNLGLIAGDGWLGDSLDRFEPAGGGSPDDGLTVWTSRWASGEDAKDFAYCLERCLQARFPGEAILDAPAGRVLARADRVYRLEVKGAEVLFSVATPRIDALMAPAAKKKVPDSQPKKSKK